MKNIEKYKDEIIASGHSDITCCVNALLHMKCSGDCEKCKKYAMKWLLEECKEPILDDAEREYLSEAIKPFRKKVAYIRKNKSSFKDKQFISLGLYNDDFMYFPYFENDAMYKGMELGRKYTVKELGL